MALVSIAGCSTTRLTETPRSGIEQLLLSTAIERSLDQVDFSALAGRSIYVDDRFVECVDKKYLVASLRRKLLAAGVQLAEKPEDADWVLEVSSASVGTDRSEGFVGIPSVNIPGPLPVHTPEVRLISHTTQFGTAKIGLVLYDSKLRVGLGPGALAHTRVTNTNWFVLGLGPINSGSLRSELIQARQKSEQPQDYRVALVDPHQVARLAQRNGTSGAPASKFSPEDQVPMPASTPWQPPAGLGLPPDESGEEHPPRGIIWPPDPNMPALPLPSGDGVPLLNWQFLPSIPLPFVPSREGD